MATLDPLERVVSALARDPNLPRVKKLLYCACYGVWEDSPERLNQVSLREVVQGVWERSPTLEALQFQLNRVVKTLNKPVAYAHVANGVLRILTELYLDTYDMTRSMDRVGKILPPTAPSTEPNTGPITTGLVAHQPPGSFPSMPPSPSGQAGGYGIANPTARPYDQGNAYSNQYDRGQLSREGYGAANAHGAANRQHYSSPTPLSPESFSDRGYNQPRHGEYDYQQQSHSPGPSYPGDPYQGYRAHSHSSNHNPAAPRVIPASKTPTTSYVTYDDPLIQTSDELEEEIPSTQWFTGQADSQGASPAQLSAQAAVRSHVIRSLADHPEQLRIKKLLLCVCESIWENNQTRLIAVNWEELLDSTCQLAPTLENLDQALQGIVNSLSKPVEYLRVAQIILDLVTPLYEQNQPDETQFFGMSTPAAQEDPTGSLGFNRAETTSHSQIHHSPGHHSQGYSPAHQAPPSPVYQPGSYPHPPGPYPQQQPYPSAAPLHNAGDSLDGPSTALSASTLPTSPMDAKYPPRALPKAGWAGPDVASQAQVVASYQSSEVRPNPTADIPESQGLESSSQKAAEPDVGIGGATFASLDEELENEAFTLRLTLMRYANPIMAKTVAFSALHRLFRFSEQDWMELRHHSLSNMLADLQSRYPNFTDLEMKLCSAAEQLELSEQAMQTAAAILKALKPSYEKAQPTERATEAVLAPSDAQLSLTSSAVPNFSVETATAIQFGPDSPSSGSSPAVSDQDVTEALDGKASNSGQATVPPHPSLPEATASEEQPPATAEAFIVDDLEADLALLAASLEEDGPSIPLES